MHDGLRPGDPDAAWQLESTYIMRERKHVHRAIGPWRSTRDEARADMKSEVMRGDEGRAGVLGREASRSEEGAQTQHEAEATTGREARSGERGGDRGPVQELQPVGLRPSDNTDEDGDPVDWLERARLRDLRPSETAVDRESADVAWARDFIGRIEDAREISVPSTFYEELRRRLSATRAEERIVPVAALSYVTGIEPHDPAGARAPNPEPVARERSDDDLAKCRARLEAEKERVRRAMGLLTDIAGPARRAIAFLDAPEE